MVAVLALGALWEVMPSLAHAETTPQVYVVDMEKVIAESIAGKAAKANLNDEVRKAEGKLALQRAELERLQADLEKQASLLSPAAMDERREALQRKARDYERSLQDQREAMGKRQASEMKRVVDQVNRVVEELSRSGAYPVIMEKDPRVVVYAAQNIDLTEKVIERMNEGALSR
jgi:outer membrane protein